MPPQRKRLKVASSVEDIDRCSTRVNKRRETLPPDQIRRSTARKMLRALPSMICGMLSGDCDLQLDSTTQLLKLVSLGDQFCLDQVTVSGAVPRLLEFLEMDDYPSLQRRAARVLKNIAAGTPENVETLVRCGAIPAFVKLLGSSSVKVVKQALCTLGNMASDSPRYRDCILGCGALPHFLALLNENNHLSLLRTATWTLSNFCEVKPKPSVELIAPAVPVVASLIVTAVDEAVLSEACWALALLFKADCWMDVDTFGTSTCPKLVELLCHESPSVIYPTIVALEATCRNDSFLEKSVSCRAYVFVQDLLYGKWAGSCIQGAARATCGSMVSSQRKKWRLEKAKAQLQSELVNAEKRQKADQLIVSEKSLCCKCRATIR